MNENKKKFIEESEDPCNPYKIDWDSEIEACRQTIQKFESKYEKKYMEKETENQIKSKTKKNLAEILNGSGSPKDILKSNGLRFLSDDPDWDQEAEYQKSSKKILEAKIQTQRMHITYTKMFLKLKNTE